MQEIHIHTHNLLVQGDTIFSHHKNIHNMHCNHKEHIFSTYLFQRAHSTRCSQRELGGCSRQAHPAEHWSRAAPAADTSPNHGDRSCPAVTAWDKRPCPGVLRRAEAAPASSGEISSCAELLRTPSHAAHAGHRWLKICYKQTVNWNKTRVSLLLRSLIQWKISPGSAT